MKLIKVIRKESEGGVCSNCSNRYYANNGWRVLCEYDGITEPFCLCKKCKNKIQMERKI
jgi:hypothetical protein